MDIVISFEKDRMTLRGRLASPDQLASNTARPQARADSLLSIQVHESAMNNFVSQLGLEGRQGPLEEVVADVVKRAGMGEFHFASVSAMEKFASTFASPD